MAKLSPKEIERLLGEQYADVLMRSGAQAVAQDCKEVINASLAAMEHYNRMALALGKVTSGFRKQTPPPPVSAAPENPGVQQNKAAS